MLSSEGHVEISHVGFTEKIHNVENGIEQSWHFPTRPHQDIVIEVRVDGQEYVETTSTGLHFMDVRTGLGFVYSHAFWVENSGRRSPIISEWYSLAHSIVLKVPSFIIQESSFPAVLDPVVSAEYGTDNPVIGPAHDLQYEPDVAYSGVPGLEYLVVWTDRRREGSFSNDVYGARVSASGQVVDTVGFRLSSQSNAPGDERSPVAAWTPAVGNGVSHWFVAWSDSPPGGGNWQIRGRRVRIDGALIAPDFDISSKSDQIFQTKISDFEPDISLNPYSGGAAGVFIVVWRTMLGGVKSRRFRTESLGGSDSMDNEDQILHIPSSGFAETPKVSAGDSNVGFFLTWSDNRNGNHDIFGRLIYPNNTLGPEREITSNFASQRYPQLARAGSNGWIVVWEDLRNVNADVFGQRIDELGEVLGSNFAVASGINDQVQPSIAAGAGAFDNMWFITWSDSAFANDIYGKRLRLVAGVLTDLGQGAISTALDVQVEPAVAYDASNARFFTVWSDARASSAARDIYGAGTDASSGAVLTSSLLSTASNRQSAPSTAACGNRTLVAWTDTRSGFASPDIYGILTDDSSPPLTIATIPIAVAAGRQDLPDVTCNGQDFVVVWADERNFATSGRDIYVARIRASDGLILGSGAVTSHSGSQTDPSVAFSSSAGVYQIVWSDNRMGTYDVYGKRMSSAGVIDHASEISISGSVIKDQIRPDVTYDSSFTPNSQRFFVVWQDSRASTSEMPVNWDIYGRYVSVANALSSTIAIATTTSPQYRPSVATRAASLSVDRYHVVVFEQYVSVGRAHDIVAQRVNANNSLGASVFVASGLIEELEPKIAVRNATNATVVFRTSQIGETFLFDVFGQDINISTMQLVGSSFVISQRDSEPGVFEDVREMSPSIGCRSSSSCNVLYRSYSDEDGADRVRGRTLSY